MIEIYAASHGEYAKGIVSGLNLLIGEDHQIKDINAYCDEGGISSSAILEAHFRKIVESAQTKNNVVVFFTDHQGGSVNNCATKLMMEYSDVHVIAGMNQSMLMDFALSDEEDIATRIKDAIEASKESIAYVNELPEILEVKEQLQGTSSNTENTENDFF
ncbi:MAG: PTS sugar transporter subunit IIA [Vibrio sp.]